MMFATVQSPYSGAHFKLLKNDKSTGTVHSMLPRVLELLICYCQLRQFSSHSFVKLLLTFNIGKVIIYSLILLISLTVDLIVRDRSAAKPDKRSDIFVA